MFFYQILWTLVMDCMFGGGNLGQLFKRPTNVLDFCDKVIKSIAKLT
jgi:hypothetical protein